MVVAIGFVTLYTLQELDASLEHRITSLSKVPPFILYIVRSCLAGLSFHSTDLLGNSTALIDACGDFLVRPGPRHTCFFPHHQPRTRSHRVRWQNGLS